MELKKMIYQTGSRGGIWAFTLVEMLVVLAIISMLLSISIPFTSRFSKGLKIKTNSRAILSTLHIARSNAITQRRKYTVLFDVKDSSYWIEDPDGKIFEKRFKLPGSIKFNLPGDKNPDPITFEEDKIVFYPDGSVQGNSGSITITDRQGNSRTISIIASTGKISIE